METLPTALAALAEYQQFITYKLTPGGTKTKKQPVNPYTGVVQSIHEDHMPFELAAAYAAMHGEEYGVGFVFTDSDPFFFLDIDHCKQQDGEWSPLALDLLNRLDGAAVEVSQSGEGLHIFGTAAGIPQHSKKNVDKGIELYHEKRFVALTGREAQGDAGADMSEQITGIIDEYFTGGELVAPVEWTTEPRTGYSGPTDDDELIEKALASKEGAAQIFGGKASFRDLWAGDTGGDASSADMSLARRLTWWTGGDCERVERLMRRSDLVRDKWDERRGDTTYLRMTIKKAVASFDGEQRPQGATGNDLTLPHGGKGNTTLEAAVMVTGNMKVCFDEFKQRIVLFTPPPWKPDDTTPRNWTDADTIELQVWLQGQLMKPSKEATFDAVNVVAKRNPDNPLQNYLNGLTWDGVPRLDTWLSDYLKAKCSEYAGVVGRKFLISAVARALKPGCKADHMMVLEGAQGVGKSSAARALVPDVDWFTDELPDVSNKDAAMQLHGVWIVEVAEMDAMSRAEASATKKFLTRSVDQYRPPYGRTTAQFDRSCVFIGTTNDANYLKDQTGNRRFWPVSCGVCDTEGLKSVRDQVWAEAVTLYRRGEAWWLDRDEEARLMKPEQDARREADAWEGPIAEWLNRDNKTAVTSTWVAAECLVLPAEKQNSYTARRINNVLRALGWVQSKTKQRLPGVVDYPARIFHRNPNDPRLLGVRPTQEQTA